MEMYRVRGLKIDDSAKTIAKARAHALPDDKGFLIAGVSGSGKTSRVEIYTSMDRNFIKVTSSYQLVDDLRDANGDSERFADIINMPLFGSTTGDVFRTDNDLLIDGLGDEECVQNIYGTKVNLVAKALLMRYDAFRKFGCRTFLTTTLTLEQIAESYGEAVAGRIMEMCEPCVLPFESWRGDMGKWGL